MQPVPLKGGAYQARSLIASAQRCVNLYPETNPEGSPFPFTYYPTPGLRMWCEAVATGAARGGWRASNGQLFAVSGQNVYYVDSTGVEHLLGTIAAGTTPVSMADNGLVLILVDGTSAGYAIDLTTHEFGSIVSAGSNAETAFFGADRVEYVDTYFVFNRPGTRQWYISLSNVDFDMLVRTKLAGTISNAGINYYGIVGTPFRNVPLTGGSGSGATANISVSGEVPYYVTDVEIVESGTGYVAGDLLTAELKVLPTCTFTGGSGYTNGTYYDVPMSGGTGVGAQFDITVAGGTVTTISARARIPFTVNYTIGDVLTQTTGVLGGGSGFTVTIVDVEQSAAASGFEFQVTQGVGQAFDPLDIASKTAAPDLLVASVVMHREVWLIGEETTEVWNNTGAADFTFGIIPGVFIEHGCVAKYSIAKQDLSICWLSRDKQGQAMVLKGADYKATRISTFAMEAAIQQYSRVDDAEGYTYQQGGHTFYVLTFPTAEATWVHDFAEGEWHERASADSNGILKRHRARCAFLAYGKNLCADYQTGAIYEFDQTVFNDNGTSVRRIRSFPHLQTDGSRVQYQRFIAEMEVGQLPESLTSSPPLVNLRWSDDRGQSYGNAVQMPIGSAGQYLTSLSWWRLGIARSRVFELSWAADVKTALSGAYVQAEPVET